jgi:hypothetical protein
MFLSNNNNTSQQTTPCRPNMIIAKHHYAFDAVKLLDGCIEKLQQTIDRDVHCQHIALYDMKRVLLCTERLLHDHLLHVLEAELVDLPGYGIRNNEIQTLAGTVATLQSVNQAKKRLKDVNTRLHHFRNPQESPQHKPQHQMMYFPPRSATDTLLFRLIVALQLCVVRIDDAHLVLTGKRLGQSSNTPGIMAWTIMVTTGCVAGTGVFVISLGKESRMRASRMLQPILSGLIRPLRTGPMTSRTDSNNHSLTVLKLGVAAIAARWVSNQWSTLWMTDKIVKSTTAIEEWQQQWQSVLATHEGKVKEAAGSQSPKQPTELLDAKSRRLIEFAMKESTKVRLRCKIERTLKQDVP